MSDYIIPRFYDLCRHMSTECLRPRIIPSVTEWFRGVCVLISFPSLAFATILLTLMR